MIWGETWHFCADCEVHWIGDSICWICNKPVENQQHPILTSKHAALLADGSYRVLSEREAPPGLALLEST